MCLCTSARRKRCSRTGKLCQLLFFLHKKIRYLYLKHSPFHGFSRPVIFFNLPGYCIYEYLKLKKGNDGEKQFKQDF